MIERILPESVASSDVVGDDPTAELLPTEHEIVARAVARRKREVTIARTCARRALGQLGYPELAIPRGSKREPIWPKGVVGSITHCQDYCAAAVATDSSALSVGIDAEPDETLPEGVLEEVTVEAEREALSRLPGDRNWDRLLFSAKESIYKAWYPLTHRWLGFEDAFVRIDPEGNFHAKLTIPPARVEGGLLGGFSGRFLFDKGLIATSVVITEVPRQD